MRAFGLVLTLVVCACLSKTGNTPSKNVANAGHGSGSNGLPPPPPQGPQGPTCESAITNSMNLSVQAAADADRPDLKTKMDAAKPKMIASCHEDQWSPALLDCLDKARTDAATGKCTDLLTPAQQDGVTRRLNGG